MAQQAVYLYMCNLHNINMHRHVRLPGRGHLTDSNSTVRTQHKITYNLIIHPFKTYKNSKQPIHALIYCYLLNESQYQT